jgi:ABC-type uncharacterized transport system ATPase subunit
MALADRMQAIVKGKLSHSVETSKVPARTIGLMMAGVWEP